jgi:probable rRNA maturation factor
MLKLALEHEGVSLTQLQTAFNDWRPELEGQINIQLVSPAEMRRLNADYAGLNEPTDVLSFNYREDPDWEGEEWGDIAINLELAMANAQRHGHSLSDEVAVLTLHGTLHILGYDHDTTAAGAAMSALQEQLAAAAKLKYREILGSH